MKVAISAMFGLIILVLVGIGLMVFFNKGDQQGFTPQTEYSTRPPIAERSDEDITYGQEVRTLTARTRQLENQLRNQQENHQQQINQFESQLRSAQEKAQSNLGKEVKSLSSENNRLKEENDKLRNEMREQMEGIRNQLAQIKPAQDKGVDIAALVAEEIAKIKGEVTVAQDTSKTSAQSPAVQSDNVFTDDATKTLSEAGSTFSEVEAVRPNRVHHQPYGLPQNNSTGGDPIDQFIGQMGNIFSSPTSSTGKPVTGVTGATQTATRKPKQQTKFPVYTLPITTMLNDAVLITPMIGRVPVGNNVNDPFKFQVELGETNLAANGHRIPGVAKLIAAGTAIGNREQSCVRGNIHTLTFIFKDGRVHTVGGGSGSGRSGGGLAYIADPWGKPCIRGEYINNGIDYLKTRSAAAFLQGMAAAYGDAQITRETNANGFIQNFVSGNTYQYAGAYGLSSTANEIAAYVRERALGAFDVVYVPQAQKVQLIVEQQINIDYDTKARKVSYLNEQRRASYD